MFGEIITVLENNSLGMGLVFVLWIILFNKKAIEGINSKPIFKWGAYIAIIIYYVLIVIEVIQKIITK